jgi:hypothetical protein
MMNVPQNQCWSENEPFGISEVGYYNSTSNHKRLEGIIIIEYRSRVSLEQDLLVGLLLVIHIGNDIPEDEDG